ncbi:uncharacterized protein LOC105189338 [Harpegnathos saltator]|uniref:uncharacterized protein LOC105189338 n=1 Tax=Harpegnathos saltator TaxID=610380 RepID=UPI000DBEE157|nr:uncharacterized protein LOC105189338 [Harpegnathos saltator]XP_025156978.1 uncharacterized protein LOC105189338 [Harpegnathos saltator]XP_025156979.1 uncharacterized protein LOC105189338 [Harpegnathos saltator]
MVNATNVIIDCDAGVDDALALYLFLVAHKHRKLRIEAVTCVYGNTDVNNVASNVLRVLELFDNYNIPVHMGAYSPLTSNKEYSRKKEDQFYGSDGFGDILKQPDLTKLRFSHAVYALHKYTSDNKGNISIVCLGPLTNIALAINLYRDFKQNMKDLYIMGGSLTGQGDIKHITLNFYSDPESASLVLDNVTKPIYLLPWETCLKSRISYDWRVNILGKVNTPFIQMLNRVEDICQLIRKGRKIGRSLDAQHYVISDAILAGIVIRPDMARNICACYADVELHGSKTRGQIVIDRGSMKKNVHLIENFDSETLKQLLLFAVNPDQKDKSVLYSQDPTNKKILNEDKNAFK